MKLLMSPASPFVRKCRVLIRETALTDTVTEIPVASTAFDTAPELAAANPLGKIPALIRADGPAIYDSRVICRYLNDHAGANLYPASRLWELLTLEATADGIMESALAMTYEVRLRPENERSPDWIEAQWAKAARTVTAINDRWISHLTGPLNMAQIGVGCALSYLDLRHDGRGWRDGHTALADWHAGFCARDSMIATQPA